MVNYVGVLWYFYHSLPVPQHHGINTIVNYGLLPWFTMVLFYKGGANNLLPLLQYPSPQLYGHGRGP